MRRPVKPFVTEYKGPNRRPGHPTGAVQRQTEEFSYATAANEVFSRSGAEVPRSNPEDAYEAAMRAADALFSPVEKAPAPIASAPRIEPRIAVDADQHDIGAEAPGPVVHGNAGRVLRAIDEPPLPGLAELEAEHAPKRRGRKPGSKNKPKAPIFIDDAPKAPAYAQPVSSPSPLPFRDEAFDTARPLPAPAMPRKPTMPRTQTAIAGTYRAREEERFSWVRTKLKPGEEWKRRLPKVCW